MMMNLLRSLILGLLLSNLSPVLAASIAGKVVGVSDGDTITVLDDSKQQHKIRLSGIDAPEKAQAFGQKSKASLSAMVYGKQVRVSTVNILDGKRPVFYLVR